MTPEKADDTYVLHKGGPSLIDLVVPTNEIYILVTGPGMLFDNLVLATSLSVLEGCHVHSLAQLANRLEGVIFCGHSSPQVLPIEVKPRRTGVVLEIGFGPPSMYQSEIVLRTRNGESFEALLKEVFGYEGTFTAALVPTPASGHLEHHHSASKRIREHEHASMEHEG